MIVSLDGSYRWIRPLRAEDIPFLRQWEEDPEIAYFCGRKFAPGEGDVGWWQAMLRERDRTAFAIIGPQRELIGDLELEHIAWRAGEAELRVSIGDKRYWNRGIGSAALKEALDVAFGELDCALVYLKVTEDNLRAIHVYQKLGFRKIGILPASERLPGLPRLVLMELDREAYYDNHRSAANAGLGSTAAG